MSEERMKDDMTDSTTGGGPSRSGGRSRAEPAFDLLANVNYLLRRAHQRADDMFAGAMAGLDVTPRQATLLFVIGRHSGASLSELTRISGIDRGTVSEMVPRLESRGLLTQGKAMQDGRAKALSLTAAGVDMVREVVHRTRELANQVLSTLPAEYQPLFVKMLRLLIGMETEVRMPIES